MLVQLDLKVRDHAAKVRVAAPLSVPVERALDVPGPEFDRDDAVGDPHSCIVVRVHAEGYGQAFPDGENDFAKLARHCAPVRVTEDEPVRPSVLRCFERSKRVLGGGLVTVEEVLGVIDDFATVRLEVSDGVFDEGYVLVEVDTKDVPDVKVPGLPEDGDDFSLGAQKRVEGVVLLG